MLADIELYYTPEDEDEPMKLQMVVDLSVLDPTRKAVFKKHTDYSPVKFNNYKISFSKIVYRYEVDEKTQFPYTLADFTTEEPENIPLFLQPQTMADTFLKRKILLQILKTFSIFTQCQFACLPTISWIFSLNLETTYIFIHNSLLTETGNIS
jgi:hypothetical protein